MRRIAFAALFTSMVACTDALPACPPSSGVALQILGSGGPIADDARASTSYVIWVDGKSKVLIDVGAGAFLRFGEAGASFNELEFVGLSHFHTDHSSDFPALLKSGNFSGRDRDLVVAGPDGSDRFPGLNDFLNSLLDPETGAYRYLAGYLDGSAGLARLDAREVSSREVVRVIAEDSIQVDALHVPHGIVPALAFRVTAGDTSVVFATDQNGTDERFVEFAKGAAALVMHMVIPEDATGVATRLHAKPGRIGEIARDAAPGKLVLSHFMARSLRDLEANVERVRRRYRGDTVVAEDLACVYLN